MRGWMAALWTLVALQPIGALAATLCVDARNQTGTADGSNSFPFSSIQAAVNAAASGDEVAVAVGHYREAVRVKGKSLLIRGGFAGAPDYAGGVSGDFSEPGDDPVATWIEGQPDRAVVHLTDAPGSRLEGFRITGGQRGVLVDDEAWPSIVADVAITGNLIESNGVATEHGGGIRAMGLRLQILDNTIRANTADNAAGVFLHHCLDALVEGNLIEANVAHGDHGGGMTLNGSGTIRGNVFRGNRIGETAGYGWGGGLLVVEAHEGATVLSHNVYTGNFAPSAGGGVFIDEGATVTMVHELIVANRCRGAGGGIYVDASWDGRRSHATIVSCTIADNVADVWPGWGAGIFLQGSDAVIRDSILWRNAGLGGWDDIAVMDGSTLTATYTLAQESVQGEGNLSQDPLFADPETGEYRLRSQTGRWDASLSSWVRDAVTSPAIDAGDPTSAFSLEPAPNGGRINLGFDGNTALASKSHSPVTHRVRRHLSRR